MPSSKLIEAQLKKCLFAKLDNYNAQTNSYFIKKYAAPRYELNSSYLIKIPNSYINNTTSPLAMNWNNNSAPSMQYLKAFVTKQVGKMIYVDSIGYNNDTGADVQTFWSGWLQIDDITMINKL